jgi:hypothetical protein
MMFVSLDLNRKNINRAISDNMLKELGEQSDNCTDDQSNHHIDMNTNDFNYGQTVCYPRVITWTITDHSTDLFGYVLVCRITKWTDQQEGWS